MKTLIVKILGIAILSFIVFNILLYAAVVVANNCIAWDIENDLRKIELPEQTEFVEAVSRAGKIYGNGNGMQYFGAILVTSDLTEEELKEYYKSFNKDIEVERQEDEIIFSDNSYKFDKFDSDKTNYKISLWRYNYSYGETASFINYLLDTDIRAH